MIITKSNLLKGVTPTVSFGASSDFPENVTNEDFSYNYTGSDDNTLVFDFGSTISLDYVAIGGLLISGSGDGNSYAQVLDSGVSIAIKTTKRDHCFLFNFEERSFTNLQIKLFNSSGGTAPTVSYVAAGSSFEVPNGGEQSGYERQWAKRNKKSKTTINAIAAPISTLKKRITSKGTLSLPNMPLDFSGQTWQDFLDFAEDNIFFIGENSEKPQLSYACYDLENASTRAHSQTRELNNLSIKFKVYNGV